MIEKEELTLEKVSCRVVSSRLELCDEMIQYYNLEQDNEILLEIFQLDYEAEIKISMLWGDQPEDMTTKRQGREIVCEDGFGWRAVRKREGEEDYWLVFSRFADQKEAVVKDSSIYLLFRNIIVYEEGVTQIAVRYVKDGQEGPVTLLPVHKVPPELRIECFEPELGTVDACKSASEENATLFWCVIGADSCVLNPGNLTLPPVGKKNLCVQNTCDFTLTATDGEKTVTKTTRVDVFSSIFFDMFSVQPHEYHIDCNKTTFEWNVCADITKPMQIRDGSGREYPLPQPSKNGSMQTHSADWPQSADREIQGNEAQSVYYLEYTREGENTPTQLIYEREPDPQKSILSFVIEYDRQKAQYSIRWKTYQAKSVALFIRYTKQGDCEFMDTCCRAKLSSAAFGQEAWKINSAKGFPVFFLLRVINKYGEEVEKQIVFRDL